MTTTVQSCARCGQYHGELELRELTRPMLYLGMPIATHWAPCPATQEPILLRVTFDQPQDLKR